MSEISQELISKIEKVSMDMLQVQYRFNHEMKSLIQQMNDIHMSIHGACPLCSNPHYPHCTETDDVNSD